MTKFTIILTTILVFSISTFAQWIELVSGINARVVYFLDKNNGYADANGVISKTTDGGVNWSSQTDAIMNGSNAMYFTDINTGFIVNDGGKILKTTDGGKNWIQKYSTLYNYTLRSICFVNATTGFVCGYKGIILKTTDGGTNWISLTSGTTYQLRSVYFIDVNTGYAVGSEGTILKTTNGGTNWSVLTSGVTNELYSVNFTTATIGNAVGSGSIILKTTDGGANWTSQTNDTSFEYDCVFFTNANTGFITGGNNFGVGTILKTTDGGTNWTTNWTPTQSNTVYTTLCFPDANTGYAAGHGPMLKYSSNNTTVVATEDWTEIMDNNPSNYFNHIFEKKSDGVITTTSKSWQRVMTGVPTIIDSTPRTGLVSFDGTNLSFTIQGTAIETTNNSTSQYTLSIIGIGANEKSSGTYTISFTNSLWPQILTGTWVGSKNSGSGVTTELNGLNKTSDLRTKIYPNPAKDFFAVKDITGDVLLMVSDLNGKSLFSKHITANETIKTDNFTSGIYIISIKSNDYTLNQQLIIQR